MSVPRVFRLGACLRRPAAVPVSAPVPRLFSTSVQVRASAPPAQEAAEAAAPGSTEAPAEGETRSATPAGTVLTGLSIFKDKPDPVAHPDSWYPSWLWEVNTRRGVEEEAATGPGGLGAWHLDTTGMTKGQIRTAEKRLVRERRRQMRLAEKERLRKEALLAEKIARGEKIETEDPEEAKRRALAEAEQKKKEDEAYYLRTGVTPRLRSIQENKAKLNQQHRAAIREANFVKKSS